MIVLIDNYDSFTYNLVHALAALGADVRVFRNDCIEVDSVLEMKPDGVVISPGPCTPDEAGISVELVKRVPDEMPLLGVCLGHQSVGAAFGARIVNASSIMHGKTSMVTHGDQALYSGLKNPFVAGRYHSLAISEESLPPELVVEARSDDNEIMGIRHVERPVFGVQFHPESVLTPSGKKLLKNFLKQIEKGKEPES